MAQLKTTTARRWGLFVLLIIEVVRFGGAVTHELKVFFEHHSAEHEHGATVHEVTITVAAGVVLSDIFEPPEEKREEDPETEEGEEHRPVPWYSGAVIQQTIPYHSVSFQIADSGAPFITLG